MPLARGSSSTVRHAEHFLSRLDRLPRSEVDLALELYRDPDLLRAVLAGVSLPEGAQRVAVSIDDPVLGPFLIVTREGHFVTCLGRGMRSGDLPVVTRAELDALSRKMARLRQKVAIEAKVQERASAHLLRRLFVAADTVTREDFLAVAAWEPLLGPTFVDLYLAMATELLEQSPVLRRVRIRGANAEEVLHTYWNLLHAAGHMALLAAMAGDREHYASMTEVHTGARAAFSYALTGTGVVAFIVKGAWAAGRMGKLMLPDYKRALVQDVAFYELLDTLFALLAIGTRSQGTHAEIGKALRAAPHLARTKEAQRLRDVMGREVELCCLATADMLDTSADEIDAIRLRLGESFFEPGAETPGSVREELVRTLPLLSWTDGITDGQKFLRSLTLIAAAARGGPEQFYLPSEIARPLRVQWKPDHVWTLLDPLIRTERAGRKPSVRESSVGRNDPCPCGSGQKWKRCCGR